MKKILVLMCVVAGLVLAAPASAYTGHAGCPGWVAPYSTVRCAWHSYVQRLTVHASQSHWGWVDNRAGSCRGSCTSDTGWGAWGWFGYATVGNNTSHWMYIWSAYEWS